MEYTNISDNPLEVIYLYDWNNSYSSRNTELANRFEEEFISNFHYANSTDYGHTEINSCTEVNGNVLEYERPEGKADVLKITLNQPLNSGETLKFIVDYNLVLPNSKFTAYGQDEKGNVYLKNWLLWPAVYNNGWILQSNKNLDDLYAPKARVHLQISTDLPLYMYSDLINPNEDQAAVNKSQWFGEGRNCTLVFRRDLPLRTFHTADLRIATDLDDKGLDDQNKMASIERVVNFLNGYFGKISAAQLPITQAASKHSPVYGLDRFPTILQPYPKELQFELELVKQIAHNVLDGQLDTNPRDEYWLQSGLETYLLMLFVEEHYSDLKLLGNLSNWWGIRSYNIAQLSFNGQYRLFYEQMARTNRSQSLITPKDSLLKFNQTFANPYKSGLGLKYLDIYNGKPLIKEAIIAFFSDGNTNKHTVEGFRTLVTSLADRPSDWFFDNYVKKNDKIDFKITRKSNDTFHFMDRSNSGIPVEVAVIYKDGSQSNQWIEGSSKIWSDPNTDRLILNPKMNIPEVHYGNNSADSERHLFSYRPLKFKLGSDIENPAYSQFFAVPVFEFGNIYDGLSVGGYFTNHSLLRKSVRINLFPQFSTKSKIWTGRASTIHYYNLDNSKLYNVTSGIFASYNSIDIGRFGRVIAPFVSLNFRDPKDLRSNWYQNITLKYVSIANDAVSETDLTPNYGILNLRYGISDSKLFDYNSGKIDLQMSGDFGKVSLEYQFRKLSNKRQFNLRLFAGAFLFHNLKHTNFFDFSLDRPSDYLFEYNYLGRAENNGIFSQQIFISDGGFKSILNPRSGNEWMTTANISGNIYRWIEVYGDIGLSKNSNNRSPFLAYDSGIRLNLVPDYFELYFPVYSNLGWEISQPNYLSKLRYVVTTSPKRLVELFKRKWF